MDPGKAFTAGETVCYNEYAVVSVSYGSPYRSWLNIYAYATSGLLQPSTVPFACTHCILYRPTVPVNVLSSEAQSRTLSYPPHPLAPQATGRISWRVSQFRNHEHYYRLRERIEDPSSDSIPAVRACVVTLVYSFPFPSIFKIP